MYYLHGVVPLGVVPLGVVPLGVVPLGVVPLGVVPLGVVPLGVVPLGAVPLGVVHKELHDYGPARNSVSRTLSKINVATAFEVRFCTCLLALTRACRAPYSVRK